jgi:RNA polymerase sigma-70 factor (ECF subfamily)
VSGLFASARPIRQAGIPHPATFGSATRGEEFRRLYDRWFEDVSRWIRALGGPEADREDILQEVFLVVKRRLALFDGVNPAGWLYQITRRQVRDFRNRTWVKHIFTRRRVDEPDVLVAEAAEPEVVLERKQKHRVLGAILSKMHPDRRSVFVLFEIDGLSGEEIARIQAVPLNTVWSRLRKARTEFFALAARFRRSQGDGT